MADNLNYTKSLVNTNSFNTNFTNTTFQKEPPFLTLHEFKVNSFTNTDFFLGTKLVFLSSQKAETFSIFMIQDFVKPHKISAFYLDKQKSFVPNKKCLLVKDLVLTKELNSNFILMVWLFVSFVFLKYQVLYSKSKNWSSQVQKKPSLSSITLGPGLFFCRKMNALGRVIPIHTKAPLRRLKV